ISQAIDRKRRTPSFNFAVLFLDFDRFKIINDSLGHEAGDLLLVEIARRMQESLRGTDSICHASAESLAARLGGDEFVVLIEDVRGPSDAMNVAERLLARLGEPFKLSGYNLITTASIGVTTTELEYQNADDMIRDADTAMYHAKAAGKARCVLFDRAMHEEVSARLALETELRAAIDRQDFFLEYQPIISLQNRRLRGFEALIRWKHENSGTIPPGRFIACAEETGMIVPIGAWALREACRQLKQWKSTVPEASDLIVSVNVSARELMLSEFAANVESIVRESELSPDSLVLEITETMMITDPDGCIEVLGQLRKLGIHVYMDDFGTGCSSLAILHRMPIDGLKIDRSFIRNVAERRDYAAVVQAIVALAHNLNISLIAEGIELPEQISLLQSMDCEYAQGFVFSPPLSARNAEKFMTTGGQMSAAA
ncbi:MAG TPA: bifunctional diguanylate cyclase/phosphodiesterase, partial [Phycisphaerales bacterium]|nr:bifunctional diguanylate cyclase/phosphodiesterase [Phycisphaerales bacterium]